MKFEVSKKHGKARCGKITLENGKEINTPVFMPVATQGAFKGGVSTKEINDIGANIMLGNTYHLALRPGSNIVGENNGLRSFTKCDSAFLTDSGGFQVFSLKNRKIIRDGVTFQSHIDGKKIHFTPERSLDIQTELGTDIAMQLDVCPPGMASEKEIEEAMHITTQWANRTLKRLKQIKDAGINNKIKSRVEKVEGYTNNKAERKFFVRKDGKKVSYDRLWEALENAETEEINITNTPEVFLIVQGGTYPEKRLRHLESLLNLEDIDLVGGFAMGGFAVGEPKNLWYKALDEIAYKLPENKPRYLMGVGTPLDLVFGVKCGVDMFDCVLPARNARHGMVFVNRDILSLDMDITADTKSDITIKITNTVYTRDTNVLDKNCECPVCANGYTRSYIHHLFNADEILGMRLVTIHNLYYYINLMKNLFD